MPKRQGARAAPVTVQVNVDRLIDRGEVQAITGMSERELYRRCAKKTFLPGILIGPAMRRWSLHDIQAWVQRAKTGALAPGKRGYLPTQEDRDRAVAAKARKRQHRRDAEPAHSTMSEPLVTSDGSTTP